MKFTSMQSALAVGALSAIAVPALADNASGSPAELVLYVVNTTTNTAYSRGLQLNMNTLAIGGAFSASGYTSTFTGNISPGSTVEIGAVTAEAVAAGYTSGFGSQNVLSVNYTLPTILADANLINFLSTGGTYKWSIQSAGYGPGNGTGFSRRFITTSASSYDNGTNVTTGNLGMAGTDANAWSDIVSMVVADNVLNPSTTNGDGTSITNSNYLSFLNGGQNASTWYSAATSVAGAINALQDLGSAANLYEVISCCGATQSAGSKDWVLTFNDVSMDASGNINGLSLPPSHYVIPNITGLGNGKCVVLNDGSSLNQTKSFCNNGSTPFPLPLPGPTPPSPPNVGANYNVTVTGQPAGQVCLVNNGSGSMGNTDVNVSVTCGNLTYTVSGTVTGLQQGKPLALLLNSGTPVTISSNGAFTFPTTIPAGSGYAVAVGIQPSGQRCTVTNGTGPASGGNINNISVDCVNDFTVSGLVSGLKGSRLVLNLNGASYKLVAANGSFTFLTGLVSGSIYDVKVGIQPAQQFCYVSNGTGTISGASISNLSVECTDNYAVGGTVTGLNPGSCVGLQLNGSANRQVCANGSYSFASRLPAGVNYSVAVSSQPPQQVCYANNRSGSMPSTDLTNVNVTCESTYTVGGTVSGLLPGQTVTLVKSASQAAVSFSAPAAAPAQFSGAGTVGYTFSLDDARTLTSLGLYNTDLNANTVVSIWNSSGSMVTSGMFDTNLSGLDLGDLNNSGFLWLKMPSISLQPGLYTIGAFTSADHFGIYGVTSTPLNGVHVVNSSLLSFAAASDKPTVDFSGLYPNGFFGPNLRFSPSDEQITVGNGSFTFPSGVENGAQYSVVVSGQPDGVVCTVSNGSGAIHSINSFDVIVSCSSGYKVSTLAGSGNLAFADGIGSQSSFYGPANLAVDTAGNVYVSDFYNNRIRKISATGTVVTLAGSGQQGSSDGTGTAASFFGPDGIAVDSLGNVFVVDSLNNRIRKITPSGVVTTIAGSGFGYADGFGNQALFRSPRGLAIDLSGNLYVADWGNHRIRKVTPAGVVSTIAGSGIASYADGTGSEASFYWPTGVSVNSVGEVFVADIGNHRIRKITTTGVVTTFAGSGVAGYADGRSMEASFHDPSGVLVDTIGNVYVADHTNNVIRKINHDGLVSTFAGSGQGGRADGATAVATFSLPRGITVDNSGNFYVADFNNHLIRKISPNAGAYNIGDSGPAGGIVFYITDGGAHGLEVGPVDLGPAGFATDEYCTHHVISPVQDIGSGRANTNTIIAQCGTNNAAYVAKTYVLNGYNDWYLPSYNELQLIFNNKSIISGLCAMNFSWGVWYWSSSDHTGADWNALPLPCISTGQWDVNKGVGFALRPIRNF